MTEPVLARCFHKGWHIGNSTIIPKQGEDCLSFSLFGQHVNSVLAGVLVGFLKRTEDRP